MPRTTDDLARAAADAEAWLDSLDPDDPTLQVEDPTDLRRIGLALAELAQADTEVRDAVAAARANGRSWGLIAMVLGVSKQAARQRYGESASTR